MESSFHFNLRLILLALGALFIIAIFVDGMRRKQQRKQRLGAKQDVDAQTDSVGEDDIDDLTYEADLSDNNNTFQSELSVATKQQSETFTELDEDDYEDEYTPPTAPDRKLAEASLIADELAQIKQYTESESPTLKDLEQKAKSRRKLITQAKVVATEPTILSNTTTTQQPIINTQFREGREILMVYSVAKPAKPYGGYQLLQAILSGGLRYGPMNIFHRYESLSGKGKLLFSLARVEEPGTLDIQKMGQIKCQGLIFFLELKPQAENIKYFDMMLETAHQISNDLGGQLLDDHKKQFTKDSYMRYRRRVENYTKLMAPPFAKIDD